MIQSNNVKSVYCAPLPGNASTALPIDEKSSAPIKISNASTSLFLKPVKKLVQRLLLPASGSSLFTSAKSFNQKLAAQKKQALEKEGAIDIQLNTGDGATIDGMYFPSAHKKAILYVGGQNERYELGYKKMRDLKSQAGDPALLVFNPRQVGKSQGSDPNAKTLAIDVYSAFRYLVDVQGIDPNDIVIFGHSLGGGYGAEGAKLVQEAFPHKQIQFVSHNSFRDLLHLLKKKLRWKWLQWLVFPIIKKLVEATHWQLNSIDALRTLKGKKMIIVNSADGMIRYNASLYRGVKYSKKPFDFVGFKMDPKGEGKDQHSRRFNAWEMSEVASQIAGMLQIQCPVRAKVLANLNQLEKAIEKKNQIATRETLNQLEGINKDWDWSSNMAHVLFKRIFFLCGANSTDPEFGRKAFLESDSKVADEKKLDVVRTLKKELAEHLK